MIKYCVFCCLLCVFFCCTDSGEVRMSEKSNSQQVRLDSLIKRSGLRGLRTKERKKYLDTAYFISKKIKDDTIRSKYFTALSYRYYSNQNFKSFRELNYKTIRLSQRTNDTSRLAISYWDLGNYFCDHRFENDSAYYYYSKAQRLYSRIGNDLSSAKLLYNISRVKQRVKDYIGSEVALSKAIPVFKALDRDENLYNCYNNLGIASVGLAEFDEAIAYYDKALEYIPKKPLDVYKKIQNINNIGVVYKRQENFDKALEVYNKALGYDSVYYKFPKLYALLLNNSAHSRLKLKDTVGIARLFYRALRIRDSLGLRSDISVNKLHLSEFFAFKKDTSKALDYALGANKLAAELGDNESLLASYLLLADLDKEKGVEYAKMHINLSDSIQREERKIRNKFARIQFETEEIADRNKELSKQRYWISALLGVTVVIALLGWIIFSQRARNEALEFERMQQRANEEIFNLMLSQQSKLEEGSQREKKRISEELHDGVLGRMFGTRLTLGSLNDKDDAQSKKTRLLYLKELKSIEEEVRGISHELNNEMFNSEISYLTLVSALLEAQSVVTKFDYTVDSDFSIDWNLVSGDMKINIYRIIQEAVQNINKYAKAGKVTINFEKIQNSFVFSIHDNGIGFDVHATRKGIGLKNIHSRVTKLGGELDIISNKNEGTLIHIQVPFKILVNNEETV